MGKLIDPIAHREIPKWAMERELAIAQGHRNAATDEQVEGIYIDLMSRIQEAIDFIDHGQGVKVWEYKQK